MSLEVSGGSHGRKLHTNVEALRARDAVRPFLASIEVAGFDLHWQSFVGQGDPATLDVELHQPGVPT